MRLEGQKTTVISDVSPEMMDELLGVKVVECGDVDDKLTQLFEYFHGEYARFMAGTPRAYELDDPKSIIPILFIFDRISNTQEALRAMAGIFREGSIKIPELSTVMAVTQTNGIGFRGRKWSSGVKGNLHASVFSNILSTMNVIDFNTIDQKVNENVSLMLPMIVPKLLADSLKALLGKSEIFGREDGLIIRPWNDIMLEMRKKLAGVLIQSAVIGIGVNFRDVPVDEDFESDGITSQTASIDEIVRKFAIENNINPYMLLKEFCERFKKFVDELSECKNDATAVSKLLRRAFKEYKAYFHGALNGKEVELYNPRHSHVLARGTYSDVERFPIPAIRITTSSGEKTVNDVGGIKII
ncbi:MAG: hypothetical protein WC269_00485 [Candidatus Gracilibacteria bacterium]|jgi:biotin-(acetyl-CoA carboxylase) ligase